MRHFYVWRLWSLAFVLAVPITPYAETLSNFVGRHLSEVKAEAEAKDIVLVTQRVDSPERRGEILLQIPGGGSEIGTNRMVFLEVSDGLIVPDLHDRSEAKVKAELNTAGIGSMSTRRRHPCVHKGIVADQIPEAGTRIDAYRNIVFLDVSDDSRVEVPDIPEAEEKHDDEIQEILKQSCLAGKIERDIISMGIYIGPYECLQGRPILFENPDFEGFTIEPDPGTLVDPRSQVVVFIKYHVYEPPRCPNQDAWDLLR